MINHPDPSSNEGSSRKKISTPDNNSSFVERFSSSLNVDADRVGGWSENKRAKSSGGKAKAGVTAESWKNDGADAVQRPGCKITAILVVHSISVCIGRDYSNDHKNGKH